MNGNGHSQPILKTHHNRSGSGSKSRFKRLQFGYKTRSLVRVLVAAILVIIILSALRRHFFPPIDLDAIKSEEIVLGNCASIETLRHADECFEAFDFQRSRRKKPERHLRKQSKHLEHEDSIPWISSYGLVLDYDATFDRFPTDSKEELYTTKRTLKCLTGFHMSIVWDIEFSTPLILAYKNGDFGLSPNTTNEIATSCPSPEHDASASMSIKINCGIDIERDAWGHPRDEKDHSETETCLRMAWSWVTGRVGDQYVAPWAGLCYKNAFGEFSCNRDVFHLEGAD